MRIIWRAIQDLNPRSLGSYASTDRELDRLADAIGVFIERYESDHVPYAAGKPADVLRFLMSEHGLRQSDSPYPGPLLRGEKEKATPFHGHGRAGPQRGQRA